MIETFITFVLDLLRDSSPLDYGMALLPALGSVSLAQIWRLHERDRTGMMPRTYRVQLVNTLICILLSSLVYLLLGDHSVAQSIGLGIMIGPAAPALWYLGAPRLMACIGGMLNGRGKTRAVWSRQRRDIERSLYDTMSDAEENTLRDAVKHIRDSRRAEREWRGE